MLPGTRTWIGLHCLRQLQQQTVLSAGDTCSCCALAASKRVRLVDRGQLQCSWGVRLYPEPCNNNIDSICAAGDGGLDIDWLLMSHLLLLLWCREIVKRLDMWGVDMLFVVSGAVYCQLL